MIFKSKYNFVISELNGQPCCDLERNNKKIWNKSLQDFLESIQWAQILRHIDHKNKQCCFCAVFYKIGMPYLLIISWKAKSPSKRVSNGYISNHNKKVTLTPKSQSIFLSDICAVSVYILLK